MWSGSASAPRFATYGASWPMIDAGWTSTGGRRDGGCRPPAAPRCITARGRSPRRWAPRGIACRLGGSGRSRSRAARPSHPPSPPGPPPPRPPGPPAGGRAAEPPSGPHGPGAPLPVAPRGGGVYDSVADVSREGAVPLLEPVPGMAARDRLHIAVVIPSFRRGSGGHSTIYNLLSRLEERGHTVSPWLHDPAGRLRSEWPGVIRRNLRDFFRPIQGPVFKGFDRWYGADVVLATGWDTVYPVLRLPWVRARAYLVQDHEPEFFATSAESVFAERTYGAGLHVIAASPWLRDLIHDRYGAEGTAFSLGVDHAVYYPRPIGRRRDTVIFYARDVTPRRAVPLGIHALQELHRRRPGTRFVLFGGEQPVSAPFPYGTLGVASPDELAWAYSEATVGLSLSLTNHSLIPQEMLACGLPCVELAGRSIESVYGPDGPIELAAADAVALADGLERLPSDPDAWERRSRDGLATAASYDWERSADELEHGLREALRTAAARTG